MNLCEILEGAERTGASDVHLSSGHALLYRINGKLERGGEDTLHESDCLAILSELSSEVAPLPEGGKAELDFAFDGSDGVRFRGHAYRHLHGVAISLRRLPTRSLALEELGLPPVLRSLARATQGLLLVTGPTGSGKSTTASALIHLINHDQARHIITIEDPIEVRYRPSLSLISQRQVGVHTESFSQALRAALREDPDVIFVGEMRDFETINLALIAAETGHLVISTLHTSSAAKTVARIIDVFPAEQQGQIRALLADNLAAVVSQDLIPRIRGGRVVVAEVLIATPAVCSLIRDGKTHQLEHVMQTSSAVGMQTRERALRALMEAGEVGAED